MTVFYKTRQGGRDIDLDDLYVRKSIFQTGNAWVWGFGGNGRLGDNSTTSKSSPVQVLGSHTNWKVLTSTAGIKTDGTFWNWGGAFGGSLGDLTSTNKSSPVQTISTTNNWHSVSINSGGQAAIKTDGSLWTWGNNNYGEIGDNTLNSYNSPVQTIARGNDWKFVTRASYGCLAVKTNGSLWTWGVGDSLGDNTTVSKSSPVQTVTGGNNWVVGSLGTYHASAIKTDGTLWVWGYNAQGQLGTNNTTSLSSPVQTVTGGNNWKQVSCGEYNTAAIKTDGTLWLWGDNGYGQYGDNTLTTRSSPVQTVTGGNNWRTVSMGGYSTAAIKTDGTLWLWGYNANGELGTNNTTSRSSPVQTVTGGNNWISVHVQQVFGGSVGAIRG